jgi:hypothetical protein
LIQSCRKDIHKSYLSLSFPLKFKRMNLLKIKKRWRSLVW